MPDKVDHKYLKNLRILGVVEAISTLVLFFIAMPLKYMGGMPEAVSIAGPIHGFLFVALVYMLLYGIKQIPISKKLAITGIIAAVFPFGPFIVDRQLDKVEKGETV